MPTTTRSQSSGDDFCLADVMRKLEDNRRWMEEKFNSISNTIDLLCSRVKLLEDEKSEHAKTLQFYGAEIEELKSKLGELERNRDVPTVSSITKLQKSLRKVEQDRNLKTLVINGVPATKNENLFALIEKLSESLELKYSPCDIDSIFRVKPKSDSPKPAVRVVKYMNMCARDAFYDGRKQMIKKNVTTKTLGINDSDDKIYINEQLNSQEAELFYKSRKRKHELSYKYAWTFHGNVFMRKTKSSDAIRIDSEKDLIDLT